MTQKDKLLELLIEMGINPGSGESVYGNDEGEKRDSVLIADESEWPSSVTFEFDKAGNFVRVVFGGY